MVRKAKTSAGEVTSRPTSIPFLMTDVDDSDCLCYPRAVRAFCFLQYDLGRRTCIIPAQSVHNSGELWTLWIPTPRVWHVSFPSICVHAASIYDILPFVIGRPACLSYFVCGYTRKLCIQKFIVLSYSVRLSIGIFVMYVYATLALPFCYVYKPPGFAPCPTSFARISLFENRSHFLDQFAIV